MIFINLIQNNYIPIKAEPANDRPKNRIVGNYTIFLKSKKEYIKQRHIFNDVSITTT